APRLALETGEIPIAAPSPKRAAEPAEIVDTNPAPGIVATASAGARLFAGAIDVIVVIGIDVAVIYFTLKVCDMTVGELPTIPLAPLLGFLCLLNGGYLPTFVAAGGQTIGKMAAGIRVVPADPAAPVSERVTLGHAIVRAAGYVVSAAP